jgi:hypothetical protein
VALEGPHLLAGPDLSHAHDLIVLVAGDDVAAVAGQGQAAAGERQLQAGADLLAGAQVVEDDGAAGGDRLPVVGREGDALEPVVAGAAAEDEEFAAQALLDLRDERGGPGLDLGVGGPAAACRSAARAGSPAPARRRLASSRFR